MSQKPWFRKLGSTAACVKRAVLAAKLQLTLHNLGDKVFQPDVIIQNFPSELYSNVQRRTVQDGDSNKHNRLEGTGKDDSRHNPNRKTYTKTLPDGSTIHKIPTL